MLVFKPVCVLTHVWISYNSGQMFQSFISSFTHPSIHPHSLAHPINNLLFRQLTEPSSAPVDEIMAQTTQYVS